MFRIVRAALAFRIGYCAKAPVESCGKKRLPIGFDDPDRSGMYARRLVLGKKLRLAEPAVRNFGAAEGVRESKAAVIGVLREKAF
jgi:hypothetical protein